MSVTCQESLKQMDASLRDALRQGIWEFNERTCALLNALSPKSHISRQRIHLRLARQSATLLNAPRDPDWQRELQQLMRASCPRVRAEAASVFGFMLLQSVSHPRRSLACYQSSLDECIRLGEPERFCYLYLNHAVALTLCTTASHRDVSPYVYTANAWAWRSGKPAYQIMTRSTATRLAHTLRQKARQPPLPSRHTNLDSVSLTRGCSEYKTQMLLTTQAHHGHLMSRRQWKNYLSLCHEHRIYSTQSIAAAISERALQRGNIEGMLDSLFAWIETRQAQKRDSPIQRPPALQEALQTGQIAQSSIIRTLNELFTPIIDIRQLPRLALTQPTIKNHEPRHAQNKAHV